MEVPIKNGKDQKKQSWRVSVYNLMENKAEGVLIIQTPEREGMEPKLPQAPKTALNRSFRGRKDDSRQREMP